MPATSYPRWGRLQPARGFSPALVALLALSLLTSAANRDPFFQKNLRDGGFNGVLSVECGTVEQARRSLAHLNTVLAQEATHARA